jgi:hypothetical protein
MWAELIHFTLNERARATVWLGTIAVDGGAHARVSFSSMRWRNHSSMSDWSQPTARAPSETGLGNVPFGDPKINSAAGKADRCLNRRKTQNGMGHIGITPFLRDFFRVASEKASSDMAVRVENLKYSVKTQGFTLQFLLAQCECASGGTRNIGSRGPETKFRTFEPGEASPILARTHNFSRTQRSKPQAT